MFKSMYTELLAAAIEVADLCELESLSYEEKLEWKEAKLEWRKELYRGRKKIAPLKKKLDKKSNG